MNKSINIYAKNIEIFYTISEDNIIWNKRDVIKPIVKEEYDLVDYIFNNSSYKFFIRKNDDVSNTIRLKHYWPDCTNLYNVWDEYDLWNYNYFFDVGANIGSCSILMLYKNIKVVCFEPLKNNQHLITKTLFYNKRNLNNINLYKIGLSNESKKVTIYRNYRNWGASSIYKKTDYPEEISIYRLDDININVKERIGMMKIDIECNELNMIEGAKKFIQNHFIKLIYFEQYCDCYFKYNKKDPYYIYDLLRTLGYSIKNQLNCSFEKGKDVIAVKVT